MEKERIKVVVVSGLSGAGKTVALRALEDMGYFCIDNLPVTLIEPFLSTVMAGGSVPGIAIGVDIREKRFLADVYSILSLLKGRYLIEILFLEAEKDVMVRRYKETRRPHPMQSLGSGIDMEAAIEEERKYLSAIRDAADRIIDTSNYSPHQLRRFIIAAYGQTGQDHGLAVSLVSFGFKFGVPQEIDLLLDVRFLPNPYFIPELRPLKGTDTEVSKFVMKSGETVEFLARATALLDFLLPHYVKEGRSYLVIGIGCTGGRHRSPAIVEALAGHIRETQHMETTVIHRDME
jgi:UPF0042 nucleotide-binding protein